MMRSPDDWPMSPHHSQRPWELQTEYRVTKAEGRLDGHDQAHKTQHVWNKGFSIALLSLGSAVAHSKAEGIAGVLIWLARALRP